MKTYTRSRRATPAAGTVTYYATTETQSRSTASTIIAIVVVPAELSLFRQQFHALKMAKKLHPGEGICGIVERGKLPLRVQSAVAKKRPTYIWEPNWDAEIK